MSRRHMSTKAPNVKLRPAPARALSHTEGTIQQGSASRSGSIKGKERALDEDATKDDADTSFDITHAVVDDKPLRDVVVCMTGIKDGRSELQEMAQTLGARIELALTTDTTHLVAEGVNSAKYKCALEHGKHIVQPSFLRVLHQQWIEGEGIANFRLDDFSKMHRLPALNELSIAITAYPLKPSSIRLDLSRRISAHSGTYRASFDKFCSHLLIGPLITTREELLNNDKYQLAAKLISLYPETAPKVVWSEWFDDSLRCGGALSEERYLVQKNPRPSPQGNVATLDQGLTEQHVQDAHTHSSTHVDSAIPENETSVKTALLPSVPSLKHALPDNDEEELAHVRKRARGLDRSKSFNDHIGSLFGRSTSTGPQQTVPEEQDTCLINSGRVVEQTLGLYQASAAEHGTPAAASMASRKTLFTARSASFAALPNSQRTAPAPFSANAIHTNRNSQASLIHDLGLDGHDAARDNPRSDAEQDIDMRKVDCDDSGFADSTNISCDHNPNACDDEQGQKFAESGHKHKTKQHGKIKLSEQTDAQTRPQSDAALLQEHETSDAGIFSGKTLWLTGYSRDANGKLKRGVSVAKAAIEKRGGKAITDDDPPSDGMSIDWIVVPLCNAPLEFFEMPGDVVSDAWLEQCFGSDCIENPDQCLFGRPIIVQHRNENRHQCFTFSGFRESHLHVLKRVCRAAGFEYSTDFSQATTCVITSGLRGEGSARAEAAKKPVESLAWFTKHVLYNFSNPASQSSVTRDDGPLSGVSVFLSKKAQNLPDRKRLTKIITELGGIQTLGYSSSTTHVLYSGEKTRIPSEIKQAMKDNKYIVHPTWLDACSNTSSRAQERAFPFSLQVSKALPMAMARSVSQPGFSTNSQKEPLSRSESARETSTRPSAASFPPDEDDRNSDGDDIPATLPPPLTLVSTLPDRSYFRRPLSPQHGQIQPFSGDNSLKSLQAASGKTSKPFMVHSKGAEKQAKPSEEVLDFSEGSVGQEGTQVQVEAESLVTRLAKLVRHASSNNENHEEGDLASKNKRRKRPSSHKTHSSPVLSDTINIFADGPVPLKVAEQERHKHHPLGQMLNASDDCEPQQDSLRIAVVDPQALLAKAQILGVPLSQLQTGETTRSDSQTPMTRSRLQ